MFLRKKRIIYSIGVEVYTHQLRYVILQSKDFGCSLVKANIIDHPSHSLLAWDRLRQECCHYPGKIILGLCLNEVLIKHYHLSADCQEYEINLYLQQQAELLLNLQLTELLLDYEIISPIEKGKIWVRMVAARKQLIMQWLQICQKIGLVVSVLDVIVLALQRLVKFMSDDILCSVILILEKTFLTYIVFQDGKIEFSKQIDDVFFVNSTDIHLENIQAALCQAKQFYLSQSQKNFPNKMYCMGELAQPLLSYLQNYFLQNVELIHFNSELQINTDFFLKDWTFFAGGVALAL